MYGSVKRKAKTYWKKIYMFCSIPVCWSSADCSGWFRLKREARRTFVLSCLQNICFWNFDSPRSLGDMTKHSSVEVTRQARHCYLVHGVAESSRTASRACRTSSGSDTCSGGNTTSFPLSSVPDERKKRPRTAFTPAQIKSLEAEFEKNKYLSVAKRLQLSKNLKLTETQVCRCTMYGAVCSVMWRTRQSEVMSRISYFTLL